jgi:hypothetical protein
VSIIEKERTKAAVSGSEEGEIEALAVPLKDHGHGVATESPFTQRRLKHTIFHLKFAVAVNKGERKDNDCSEWYCSG